MCVRDGHGKAMSKGLSVVLLKQRNEGEGKENRRGG